MAIRQALWRQAREWAQKTSSLATERFGAEGRPPKRSKNVSEFIGMVTDARLIMLVVGGFFMFSFSATYTAKVCSKPGVLGGLSKTLVLGARLYRFCPPSYHSSFHSHASGQGTERDRERPYAYRALSVLHKTY